MTEAEKAELDGIATANGGLLLPSQILEHAADEKSVLHSNFTWDDKEAGQKYREQEARQLIRVYCKLVPQIGRAARAFISVPSDRANGDGYRKIEDVLGNPMLTEQMVDEIKKKIVSLSESFNYLRFLDPLWPRLLNELETFLTESKAAKVA